MIPILSDIFKQPGVFLGLGLGVFIGFIARGHLNSDENQKTFSNSEEEDSDWDEDDFLSRDDPPSKLVIVIRTDLKMGKGKIAAQCCHATLKAYKQLRKSSPKLLKDWEKRGQPKVVVKAENEETLLEIASNAQLLGLTCSLIQDAGRTQVAPGSRTVLGVGPGPIDLIDSLTGHLKLY